MSNLRLGLILLAFGATALGLTACSDDDSGDAAPIADAAVTDGGEERDASEDVADADAPRADADAAAPSGGACAAASRDLATSGDAQAPVLDAALSNLQRVTSNDAYCAGQKAGAHPSFGAYGYLLNVFLHDEQADGPSLDDLSTRAELVRFGAEPTFDVRGKLDPEHGFTTQGESFSVQLCLDEAYVAGAVTIAVDVADRAGHRSQAICITEATGD